MKWVRNSVTVRYLQMIAFGMLLSTSLVTWKAMVCFSGSNSPVVVVLTGSMEPGFKRGDILFLSMSEDPIRAGEIIVFNIDGPNCPPRGRGTEGMHIVGSQAEKHWSC
ncbi:hypothetical protein Scep_024212 [Stephania cephalantha]|uniref:Signal peptidase complex catalytic subunit SEC11 n=1 Tax=Stephania cephalantha TaxID=152367 RepID=A0AAP0HWX5_9MAGN